MLFQLLLSLESHDMREIPLEVLFTFPAPNYDDPETRGPGLIITIAVFTSLVTIAIALRYYTRIALKRWYGLDDVFIGLAYVRLAPYVHWKKFLGEAWMLNIGYGH